VSNGKGLPIFKGLQCLRAQRQAVQEESFKHSERW